MRPRSLLNRYEIGRASDAPEARSDFEPTEPSTNRLREVPFQERSRGTRIAVEQMAQDSEVLPQGGLDLVHRNAQDRVD